MPSTLHSSCIIDMHHYSIMVEIIKFHSCYQQVRQDPVFLGLKKVSVWLESQACASPSDWLSEDKRGDICATAGFGIANRSVVPVIQTAEPAAAALLYQPFSPRQPHSQYDTDCILRLHSKPWSTKLSTLFAQWFASSSNNNSDATK